MTKSIYLILLCCSFFFVSETVKAQESSKPEIIQTISVRKGQPQQVYDKAYYERKIKEIDELLHAIDVKITYVKSDASENKIALENGWYENMERVKKDAQEQRLEYETTVKKMTN